MTIGSTGYAACAIHSNLINISNERADIALTSTNDYGWIIPKYAYSLNVFPIVEQCVSNVRRRNTEKKRNKWIRATTTRLSCLSRNLDRLDRQIDAIVQFFRFRFPSSRLDHLVERLENHLQSSYGYCMSINNVLIIMLNARCSYIVWHTIRWKPFFFSYWNISFYWQHEEVLLKLWWKCIYNRM